ncbi:MULTISPECIES: glycosyltransferase [unclassified Carboxylicivirga]|uniref:glycosyltransferase n=1 Tax=Carboxylicivirga TaxID=1628153 RepID=UPI003D328A8C
MKILFINSIGKHKWGGGEKWMVLAAQELMKRGHHVLIGCRKNSVLEHRAKSGSLPVVNFSVYTDISLLGGIQIASVFKKEAIDIIVACQNKDVRVAGCISKLLKGPLVISRQGVQLMRNTKKYKWTFKPFCDGIITNTQSIKKEYDSYGWWSDDYVKVIYNGIPIGQATNTAFDLEAIGIKRHAGTKIILSTGRLAKQKGFEYLIDAASYVLGHTPDTHFLIAGQGRLEQALKQQIESAGLSNRIHMIGFQNNVPALLQVADIFVLSSLYEGMPNALMEALAHGTPAVSTRVNGVEELMNDPDHGCIVPPGDSKALAQGILKLLEYEDLDAIGLNAQEHMKLNFSVDTMVNSLEEHLEQLIVKQSK